MSSKTSKPCDIVVVGAGPVGSTLALLADSFGFNTVLVDARESEHRRKVDIRNLAIVSGSWRLLKAIAITDEVEEHCQPLNGLEAVDGGRHLFHSPKVEISNADLGVQDCPLGYMVEAKRLQNALDDSLHGNSRIDVIRPAKFESMCMLKNKIQVNLNSHEQILASLVVACDGSNSKVRESAGIKTEGHEYGKSVVTANVLLDHDHNGVARQFFTREGPFATLPLLGGKANLAWYVRSETANSLASLKNSDFEVELNGRFGNFAGHMKVSSAVLTYPLKMQIAERMIRERVALVGEAARTVNPLAGQGLNLGFKDVAALIEVLVDARRLGLDLGSLTVLERYQTWRRPDSNVTALSLDTIDWLFTNRLLSTKLLRGIALSTANQSKFLRKFLARYASATHNGLPRLLLGETLDGT